MRTSSSSAAVAAPSIALCASRSRTSGSMRRLYPTMGAVPGAESPYDAIARLYDPWSRSVTEDVDFYVEEAVESGGPVVELGVGTGRIAVPTAAAGIHVIGVDSSQGMLDVCAEAARRLLFPGGRLVFDVFAPGQDDIEETHARWLEREPGIYERADWDTEAQVLRLSVRGPGGETTMTLSWLEPSRWQALLAEAGFAAEAVYGWFDRRAYAGGEDTVFVARKRA